MFAFSRNSAVMSNRNDRRQKRKSNRHTKLRFESLEVRAAPSDSFAALLGLGAMAWALDGMIGDSDRDQSLPDPPRRSSPARDWALYAAFESRSLERIVPTEESPDSGGQSAVASLSIDGDDAGGDIHLRGGLVNAALPLLLRTITNDKGRKYVDMPSHQVILFIPSSQVADVYSYPSISQVTAAVADGSLSTQGATSSTSIAPREHGAIRRLGRLWWKRQHAAGRLRRQQLSSLGRLGRAGVDERRGPDSRLLG